MKRTAAAATGVIGVLLLSGCSANLHDSAQNACTELASALYRTDERAKSAEVENVTATARPGADFAFDVQGNTRFTYESGRQDVYRWQCFAQTIDGKTHADLDRFTLVPS